VNIYDFKDWTLNRPAPRLVNVTFRSTSSRFSSDERWIDIRPYEWIDPKVWRIFTGLCTLFDAEPGAEAAMKEAESHVARVSPELAVFLYADKVVRYMGGKREEFSRDRVRS